MDKGMQIAKQETREYHLEYYLNHRLFKPGSWLEKSDKAIEWIIKMQFGPGDKNALDIGCGVGRNALPLAVAGYNVDCVDTLPEALELLRRNSILAGVRENMNIWTDSAESVQIRKRAYNLILAVSVLEHCESLALVEQALHKIQAGTRFGGAVLVTISTDRNVSDFNSGNPVPTFVETPMTSEIASSLLHRYFGFWQSFALETEPFEEKLTYRGRQVIWRSSEVRMLAVKGTSE